MSRGDGTSVYKHEGDPMPVFVLKAKDTLALTTIEVYRQLCDSVGLHRQGLEVEAAIEEIRAWQLRNPGAVKFPDHEHVPVSARARTQGGASASEGPYEAPEIAVEAMDVPQARPERGR